MLCVDCTYITDNTHEIACEAYQNLAAHIAEFCSSLSCV